MLNKLLVHKGSGPVNVEKQTWQVHWYGVARGTELSLEIVLDTGSGVNKPGEVGKGDILGRIG